MDEEQFHELQQRLMRVPDSGSLIQQTGGLRKLRFKDFNRQRGKRGGIRITYYWWKEERQIWLFTLYSKGEVRDLTASERTVFRKMLRNEIKARVKNHD